MHQIHIPAEILARARLTRGPRDHILAGLDPARTAHVIVDLQNGFVEEGAPIEVPYARDIIGNVNAISAAVRAAGGLNLFLRFTYDPKEPQPWTAFYKNYHVAESERRMAAAFSPGAPMLELWPGLDVRPGDVIVDKTRFSGLIPGTSDMHEILQKRGIDTLIITGTLTNCCCESTARDALQMNYNVVFVADGNAALTDAEHNATLVNMAAIFADVMTTDEVVAVVSTNAVRQASAA